MPPEKPETEDDFDMSPEEEDELERAYEASLKDEREGRLIPHEALFPPRRLTG